MVNTLAIKIFPPVLNLKQKQISRTHSILFLLTHSPFQIFPLIYLIHYFPLLSILSYKPSFKTIIQPTLRLLKLPSRCISDAVIHTSLFLVIQIGGRELPRSSITHRPRHDRPYGMGGEMVRKEGFSGIG